MSLLRGLEPKGLEGRVILDSMKFLCGFFVLFCFAFFFLNLESSLRERNGNPLQYSCLRNPWTEEPRRLQSMGLPKVGHDLATK